MAQIKYVQSPFIELIEEDAGNECRLCKQKEDLKLCWLGTEEQTFFICKHCFYIIKGLYIDTLICEEEEDGIDIKEQLKISKEKIRRIKKNRDLYRNKQKQ